MCISVSSLSFYSFKFFFQLILAPFRCLRCGISQQTEKFYLLLSSYILHTHTNKHNSGCSLFRVRVSALSCVGQTSLSCVSSRTNCFRKLYAAQVALILSMFVVILFLFIFSYLVSFILIFSCLLYSLRSSALSNNVFITDPRQKHTNEFKRFEPAAKVR